MVTRLLVVQYAGDYRQAIKRFSAGEDETYHSQKYSVDAIAEIGTRIDEAATLCCLTKEPYNEILENGVRAIGTGFSNKIQTNKLINLIEEYNPTHLIVRTTIKSILRWAIKNKVKTLAVLADSFETKGIKNKIKNFQLATLLNNKQIDWVGNNNLAASQLLSEIGIKQQKIIPWEYPLTITPELFESKKLPVNKSNFWQFIYVGAVTEAKGVGDTLEAIALLKSKGLLVKLKIAGAGDIQNFKNKASQLQIEDCVDFLGIISHHTVVPLMREADLVIIPSRQEYPEGLPKTIVEAFCSRTPIIASDHSMFRNVLIDQINAMIFPSGSSQDLSLCIEKLLSNPELYNSLSLASYEAWKKLQIPVEWADLINRWLFDSPENEKWLFEHRLSSDKYQKYGVIN